jgi:transposase
MPVARTLNAQLVHLPTNFQHSIIKSLAKGFNTKGQAIKADARGFRRFANYRSRILFFCGKLDLSPQLPLPAAHTIP